MKAFAKMVQEELVTARKKHPDRFSSLHEGYAILLEEVDEVWDHVRAKKPDRLKVLEELIQVGAMAQRAAEDLGLISDSPNL